MKISELMGHLDLVWQEHGDLDIQVVTVRYDNGFQSSRWSGTVFSVKACEDYPGQVEIRTTA